MLHAAAMLTGLFIVWLLLTQGWSSTAEIAAGALAAMACVLFMARFGGVGASFANAPALIAAGVRLTSAVLQGAMKTVRAGLAADVTLQPALVRIKTRAVSAEARVALAHVIGAIPGMTIVEIDADGFLAHVIDEEAIDAAEMGRIEARVLPMFGEGARS